VHALSTGTLKSLFVPGGIWLIVAVTLAYSGWLTLALPALTFLYYCAVVGGMLLAWRFHSSRIFLALLLLALAQQASSLSAGQPPYIPSTLHALAVLVPINFILIALMHERGFTVESIAPIVLFLFVQALTLTVLCGASIRATSLPVPFPLARYAIVVFALTLILLTVKFCLNKKPANSSLVWSLVAFFLAVRFAPSARQSTVYWPTTTN